MYIHTAWAVGSFSVLSFVHSGAVHVVGVVV
jgi:hypothetical protein